MSAKVLVTGRLWMGAAGARSIGNALLDLIANAKQEVILVAYRLTVAVPEFSNALESALARGCVLRVVRDKALDENPAEEKYLQRLMGSYQNFSVWDFKDAESNSPNCALHAKMLIVDRTKAIVGSANFSRNGMIENHEIALSISGPEAAHLATACDQLIENGRAEGVLRLRRP